MYIWVFCLYICLCVLCVFCWQSPEEGIDSPETGGADNHELLSECWELSQGHPVGPLQPSNRLSFQRWYLVRLSRGFLNLHRQKHIIGLRVVKTSLAWASSCVGDGNVGKSFYSDSPETLPLCNMKVPHSVSHYTMRNCFSIESQVEYRSSA